MEGEVLLTFTGKVGCGEAALVGLRKDAMDMQLMSRLGFRV